jgi:ankyrin repeat protein
MPIIIIPTEFKCPLSGKIMKEPVITAEGYTYEKKAIERWLKYNNTDPVSNQVLANKKLTPNTRLAEQINALHIASNENLMEIIRNGEYKKLDHINYSSNQFDEILLQAVKNEKPQIVEYLLKNGADINYTNKTKDTPLHIAIYNSNFENMKILLAYGADIESKNNYKETPLHATINHNLDDPQFVQILLEYGANINARDKNDKTPYQHAIDLQTLEIHCGEERRAKQLDILAELISKYDVKTLSKKIEYLENKNINLEQSITLIQKQMKLLTRQLTVLQNQANSELANNNKSNNTRKFGMLY